MRRSLQSSPQQLAALQLAGADAKIWRKNQGIVESCCYIINVKGLGGYGLY